MPGLVGAGGSVCVSQTNWQVALSENFSSLQRNCCDSNAMIARRKLRCLSWKVDPARQRFFVRPSRSFAQIREHRSRTKGGNHRKSFPPDTLLVMVIPCGY